jgi:hypothetical protein
MAVHTPQSIRRTRQRLNRKHRRPPKRKPRRSSRLAGSGGRGLSEDLRARVEIALNIMHSEGCVLRLHMDRRHGPTWVLSPGNWPVADEVARVLINEPDAVACGDGLFADGPSQTYRYVEN